MRFPDLVALLRPTTADEYGNPGQGWDDPARRQVYAFVTVSRAGGELAYAAKLPAGTDVATGDRLVWNAATFEVGLVHAVRSPGKTVFLSAVLTPVDGHG